MAEQTTITRPSPIIEEAQKSYLESLKDQVQVRPLIPVSLLQV